MRLHFKVASDDGLTETTSSSHFESNDDQTHEVDISSISNDHQNFSVYVGLSKFDHTLLSEWRDRMAKGEGFRYKLSLPLQYGVLKGKYRFIKLLNMERHTLRRKATVMTTVNDRSFCPDRFNFNKIKDDREKLVYVSSVRDNDKSSSVILVNDSPFELGHCLMVPERDANLPQILTLDSLRLAILTVMSSGSASTSLLRLKAVFNSLCAFASVNHLHWHLYYTDVRSDHSLLIENVRLERLFQISDGDDDNVFSSSIWTIREDAYPASPFVFLLTNDEDFEKITDSVFRLVSYFIDNEIAHNVYVTREASRDSSSSQVIRIIVWARQKHVGCKFSDTSKSFQMAVCELAGFVVLSTQQAFDDLSEADVESFQREVTTEMFNFVKDKLPEIYHRH